MHYGRMRRTGTYGLAPKPKRPASLRHSGGYVIERTSGHPMEAPGFPGYAYQHRRVFFDANGPGPFACHVCGKAVSYDSMDVDHLNDDPQDNRPENLAPACPPCNRGRGAAKLAASVLAKQGITHEGQTLTLNQWAAAKGISRQSLVHRLRNGWPLARALTEPRGRFGPKKKAGP
jgi:5-methylcytosine-specific restriction endonuclease McrA